MKKSFAMLLTASAVGSVEARADVRTSAARELAGWSMKKFAGKVVDEGADSLTKRIVSASAKYGDDAVRLAVRRAGPKALSLADDAAEHAPRVLRFVGKFGDEGASLLTKRSMKLLSLGDDAAAMLVKHKGVAEPLLEDFGNSATRALAGVTPRNGRRIAMLGDNLLRLEKAKDLLEVVGKYGDPAVEWIWRNKGLLATTGAMAAFIADPEPFLSGAKQLAEAAANSVFVPLSLGAMDAGAEVASSVVSGTVRPLVAELSREAARRIPWTPLAIGGCLAASTLGVVAASRRRSKRGGVPG